ncbi:hypothetical protein ABZ934_27065 [Streptomyces sp. NPDC046557]|uniref:hypothetical protein n=1 Tax=Streptomyces sp. NPDC046557 TaxID=3155372 RepID=UPI0033F347DB
MRDQRGAAEHEHDRPVPGERAWKRRLTHGTKPGGERTWSTAGRGFAALDEDDDPVEFAGFQSWDDRAYW